ncbi:hypothetical protein BN946_scf185042.g56 [Trametes cinnabarina]|uniref:Vacuolar sorting protein Vps3844 C-terminal domain-containing protein n=1 Tax=Pycnoporus cinnabarinus TaxID=5643 RepID=A0A060SA37_PYCCI|nr:hypothetical protein BN946_scf185042.g56 [Trametes cinnabarina]
MKGLLVSLLLTSLCQAVQVYLHPAPDVPSRLSLTQAGVVLSRHLNLDRFEDAAAYPGEQELIVGEGPKTGLLLTLSKEHAKDIIPPSLKSTFHLKSRPSPDSLASLIPSYIDRAHHVYSHVYEAQDHAYEKFKRMLDAFSVPAEGSEDAIQQLYSLMTFVDGENLPIDRFGAFDLTHLEDLRHTFGKDSEQYRTAVQTVKVILDRLMERQDVNLALVTVPSHGSKHHRRQQPPQSPLPPPLPRPAEPIDSISTCYSSVDVCGNATNACSGHGQCLEATKAGKTCFVCACSITTDEKGRKEQWAGSACERKDVSGPFVLLAGTTVTLLLLVGGSIALLTAVGDQKLPSTLTGGVASNAH